VAALVPVVGSEPRPSLPSLQLPDAKIVEVHRGNWENTLLPCSQPRPLPANLASSQHAEPLRPWRVDVQGHYPGWYPGVDVKHLAAAYLACEGNLPLVLRAWDLTVTRYLLRDGAVRPMTMYDNPHAVVPETTVDGSVVFYPLRLTANIDLVLLGDLIYRFSQDREWLVANLPAMRRAAAFLEGWIDDEGLLHGDSYDLDQVYREIDGVAQASAYLAFRKLAALEGVVGEASGRRRAEGVARRLAGAADRHFWDVGAGYYVEHLVYNNVARAGRLGSIGGVSSELDPGHSAANAIDGVTGIGIDAFGVGTGAAGRHEWAASHQTVGAWIEVRLREPTRVGKVILLNRTDPGIGAGERFATGYLEFSDRSRRVPVEFGGLDISRAVAVFSPRTVTWVRFTGDRMQGAGGTNAGLSEFVILPASEPYRKVSHGLTDSSVAMVAFGVAQGARAESVWRHFRQKESAFYEVNAVSAPTWIAERAETYGPSELNRRAPHKDCVAMARTWRYDALMRHRFGDGDGLLRTLGFANTLYDRPSGGGPGLFAERYGLGRFQPGDEAQATVPAYAEYPAVYNSTVVQQALLGLDVEVDGTVVIEPCVPRGWYDAGFGAEGCWVLKDHRVGFAYRTDRLDGWIEGLDGPRRIRVRLPPGLPPRSVLVWVGDERISHRRAGGGVEFGLTASEARAVRFSVTAGTR
jgi:hypothetical protein